MAIRWILYGVERVEAEGFGLTGRDLRRLEPH